ncbi:hypothetical protein TorRG33x02_044690 [Trema orientale]|uniref:Uncharacterized protein n=1 Tax=Trema orientale TaxID=63057 RepID=A0A2P5FPI3_TREOI|nr:hypothetical protein TorRG33x02_044690 [Trema orientale]
MAKPACPMHFSKSNNTLFSFIRLTRHAAGDGYPQGKLTCHIIMFHHMLHPSVCLDNKGLHRYSSFPHALYLWLETREPHSLLGLNCNQELFLPPAVSWPFYR